jgi:hypothetical protein
MYPQFEMRNFEMPLSKTSKLDGIYSWSLQAGKASCPGSIRNGEVIDVCKFCYAKNGNYRYPNVKKVRELNREEWKKDSWVDDMVKALDNERYFRWVDSGDIYSISLAHKIYEIMVKTPWVKHWLPTKMYVFPKFRKVFEKMMELDNVMVRYSSDSINGEYESYHGSTVIPYKESATADMTVCLAYENPKHNCDGCRACWDKNVPLIAYVAHGQKIRKMIKLQVVS